MANIVALSQALISEPWNTDSLCPFRIPSMMVYSVHSAEFLLQKAISKNAKAGLSYQKIEIGEYKLLFGLFFTQLFALEIKKV